MKQKFQVSTSKGLIIAGMLGTCLIVGACSKSEQAPAPAPAPAAAPASAPEAAKSQQPASAQPAGKAPDVEQIKKDLFKTTMKLAGNKLETFDKIENFKDVKILKEARQGDVIEYKVSIVYNDTTYSTFDKIEAVITYTLTQGAWKMTSANGRLL